MQIVWIWRKAKYVRMKAILVERKLEILQEFPGLPDLCAIAVLAMRTSLADAKRIFPDHRIFRTDLCSILMSHPDSLASRQLAQHMQSGLGQGLEHMVEAWV